VFDSTRILEPDYLRNLPLVKTLLEIGLFSAHKGEVLLAREIFQGLLSAIPDLRPAQAGLGLSFLAVNAYPEAEEMLLKALDQADLPEAKLFLALTYRFSGRPEAALELLQDLKDNGGEIGQLAGEIMAG
jgi:tetratricopeptide (TPR) repeat protein